jgi:hypothetical protein
MEDFLQPVPEAFGGNGPALLMLTVVLLFLIVNKDMLLESYMSRKRMKAKHRAEKEKISDIISQAVETAVAKHGVSRATADHWYKKMRTIGLKDLGYNPSFGKPWYFPALKLSAQAVKAQIKNRLNGFRKEGTTSQISLADVVAKLKHKPN